jgi:hypothetical protein
MGMNINRNMDFRHGSSQNTDMMSVNNSTQKSDAEGRYRIHGRHEAPDG